MDKVSCMATEATFEGWVNSLSVLDRQLLRDHAHDVELPDKVRDLLRYGPVVYAGWFESDPPRYFYPAPLLSALGVEPRPSEVPEP